MALIKRLTRLFKADFHAVLDSVEEPHALLKQAIREMEVDVSRDQQGIKILEKYLQQLELKLDATKQNLATIESELNVCFQTDNDSLARSTIKRKLATQRLQQELQHKCRSTETDVNELVRRLKENRARLESMQQKQEILSEESNQADLYVCPVVTDVKVNDDEVEIAFLQEKQKRMAS